MKILSLLFAASLLLFCAACSGGSGRPNPGPGPQGNFSNASLSGSYAYQMVGSDLSLSGVPIFRRAGVFTADGNGNITAGTNDFVEGSTTSSSGITGTYQISNDGTGTAVLNAGGGSSINLAITMASASKVYLIEIDTLATGSGTAEKQDTTAFANPPSGTFIFGLHSNSSLAATSSVSAVGTLTVSSGAVTGNEDLNSAGIPSSTTLTSGLFNFPDATSGRGTGNFSDGVNTTSFSYYVVNANTFLMLTSTPGVTGSGRAEKQSTGPFGAASLSGGYAFGSRGDGSNLDGARTVGRFNAAGDGTISAGEFDAVLDGVQTSDMSFTGTYTVAANGRSAVTLAPQNGGTISVILWLVSPSRAFFLVDDASRVEDGTMDLQQSTSFTNATMNGQFAFGMTGFTTDTNDFFDRVGTLQWDGAGTLTLNEAVNVDGSSSTPGFLNGTYSVAGSGRATGSIDTVSNNLVSRQSIFSRSGVPTFSAKAAIVWGSNTSLRKVADISR